MPSNLFGLAVLIAALAPGWAYLQAYRRHALRDARSATTEIVEMCAVGALATLTAALLVLAAAQMTPGLVTFETLLKGSSALRRSAGAAILSAAAILILSLTGCIGLGTLLGRRKPHRVGTVREGTVFVKALTQRSSQGHKPFLRVELKDGRLVEGNLLFVSANEDPARRDLVLQKPIAWSTRDSTERTQSSEECVVITGSLVHVVHLSYPGPPHRSSEAASTS